jgi:hypothetical protein
MRIVARERVERMRSERSQVLGPVEARVVVRDRGLDDDPIY